MTIHGKCVCIYTRKEYCIIQKNEIKKMEISNKTEVQDLFTTAYPESISETKSVINLQVVLWTLIAVVLFAIYYQQPDKDTTLGYIQLTLVIVCAVLAIVKSFNGNHRLIYTPTGSPVTKTEEYYNIALENDIHQCLNEGNTSRLNALQTDSAGGILIEWLKSRDNTFIAARMQKYYPEGYRPTTGWVVL